MAAVPISDVFVGELKRLLDGRTDGWVLLDDDGVQLGSHEGLFYASVML